GQPDLRPKPFHFARRERARRVSLARDAHRGCELDVDRRSVQRRYRDTMQVDLDRRQVLAFRIAAHGLHRGTKSLSALHVLDLGTQDAAPGAAAMACTARLSEPVTDPIDQRGMTLAWALRAAPHVYRTRDLQRIAQGTWPASDADATARLGGWFKAAAGTRWA